MKYKWLQQSCRLVLPGGGDICLYMKLNLIYYLRLGKKTLKTASYTLRFPVDYFMQNRQRTFLWLNVSELHFNKELINNQRLITYCHVREWQWSPFVFDSESKSHEMQNFVTHIHLFVGKIRINKSVVP